MKSLLLAGAMIVAAGTSAVAADYWVVGNRATSKCEIVTSNPVIDAQVGGNTTFGSGPYGSLNDAKLARSTIGACPKEEAPAEAAGEDE
jgi:opacity protein-like surface antigen